MGTFLYNHSEAWCVWTLSGYHRPLTSNRYNQKHSRVCARMCVCLCACVFFAVCPFRVIMHDLHFILNFALLHCVFWTEEQSGVNGTWMFLDIFFYFFTATEGKVRTELSLSFIKDFEMTWTLRPFREIQYILANMLANRHSQVYLSVNREILHTSYVSNAWRDNDTQIDELALGYKGKLLASTSSAFATLG